MFQNAYVINLDFKSDRLMRFMYDSNNHYGPVERWPAVHGDSVKHPAWWKSGAGAWGCYRSHLQILEHCYQRANEIESYVVFEDDAIFRTEFGPRLGQFLKELPDDWEMVYLGGQLLHEIKHPPRRVSDNVFVPYNVNRTHCFAVHRRGYEKLYGHLVSTPFADGEHVDHHLGRLHESGRLKLYCPREWLVGQDSGPSNISGNINSATFWLDPAKAADDSRAWERRHVPAIFLESTRETARELERRGWHQGHWRNEHLLDRGVCDAIASHDVKAGLESWYEAVRPEAIREGKSCVCLYHPSLHWPCVSTLNCGPFHRISANDADDAERQLGYIIGPKVPSGRGPQRNLIYHIWPKKGNGAWRWNVEELLTRMALFDGGQKTIAVVTDDASDSFETVKAAFAGHKIDNWIHLPNDPDKAESQTFYNLLESLPRDDGSITFYGHAKGVRYDEPGRNRDWAAMMYAACLDHPKMVQSQLNASPITGAFRKTSESWWHYSGSFFWFRNKDVFESTRWNERDQSFFAVESWPGRVFPIVRSGCLFEDNCGCLWDPDELARVKQRFAEWKPN